MKRDLLKKIGGISSIAGLSIALVSVALQFGVVDSSPLTINMFVAIIAAAVGATIQIVSSRKKPKKEKGQIFLIYAREDIEKVDKLYNQLKEKGFKPWFDIKEIVPGQRWKDSIRDAIQKSDVALALISKNTLNKKGFVNTELEMALDLLEERVEGYSPVIPVRLEDIEVPGRLKSLQWVNLYEKDGINQLHNALHKAAA